MTRFIGAYGAMGLPVFGILAAGLLILSDVLFRNIWIQLVLMMIFILIFSCVINAVLITAPLFSLRPNIGVYQILILHHEPSHRS